METYLRVIAEHATAGQAATTQALAQAIGVREPSVTQMVRRLAVQGWVIYQPYRAVTLTARGHQLATDLIERRTVIERYLIATLGFDPNRARQEVDRIEHAVSPQLRARMSASLVSEDDEFAHPVRAV
jgi:DtxR family Mn-dependent transcriptional regulator